MLRYNIQKEIRKEIKSGLKDDELTLIIESNDKKSDLQWIETGKEFRYKGEMFDVVRVKIKNEKKYYYCINDTKEKELIANFNKHHNSKKDNEKRIKRMLNNYYFPQHSFYLINTYVSDFVYVPFDFHNKSNVIDILSPPPKA